MNQATEQAQAILRYLEYADLVIILDGGRMVLVTEEAKQCT